jgi:hypothetical protein
MQFNTFGQFYQKEAVKKALLRVNRFLIRWIQLIFTNNWLVNGFEKYRTYFKRIIVKTYLKSLNGNFYNQ